MPADAGWCEPPGTARPEAHNSELIVVDDWPEIVPVTEAELQVF